MKGVWAVPVIASILILGTLGISYDVFADPNENEGNNACENSNQKGKACENNPNTNHPPTIGSVSIFNNLNMDVTGVLSREAGPHLCVANDVTDVDEDTVTLTYKWFDDNGIQFATGEVIPRGSIIGVVTCEVTPFDGTDFGAPASAITIIVCPPNCGTI